MIMCWLYGDRHRTWCAVSIALFAAIMSYYMEVNVSSDLNRYYYYLDFYREMSIKEASVFAILRNNPIHHLSLVLFSRLPNNQLYCSAFTFIDYFLIMKLLENVCDDNKICKQTYTLGALFILTNLNFILVSNVVRIFFVFALFFYLLYEETVRKKMCFCVG